MEKHQDNAATGGQTIQKISFLKRMWSKFCNLFEPEEVEVTFKMEGNKIHYSYTKVQHKHI